MNKKLRILAVLTATALLFASCSSTQPSAPEELHITSMEELLALVNENHRAIAKPEVDLAEFVSQMEDPDFDWRTYNQLPATEFDFEMILTYEQAAEDLVALQNTMKSLYTPYYYFGGDEVFDPFFEDIRARLEAQAQNQGGVLAGEDLFAPLYFGLPEVTQDAHMKLNQFLMSSYAAPYVFGETLFAKTTEGYRNAATGLDVTACEGYEDLDQLFKLFISEDGELVWRPAALARDEGELAELVVTYTDGSTETLAPRAIELTMSDSGQGVELRSLGETDIPWLICNTMGYENPENPYGTEFLAALGEVVEEPALVVDLRGNGGGNIMMSLKWLSTYAGAHMPTNSRGITVLDEEYMLGLDTTLHNYVPYEEVRELGLHQYLSDRFYSYYDEEDAFVENDRTLVVLTSKQTGSAAEIFVDAAHNIENTLFVGTNTFGVITSNSFTTIYLPNSGLSVGLGSDLYLYDTDYFQDYVGFLPDIWVDGDAAELVEKMLARFES